MHEPAGREGRVAGSGKGRRSRTWDDAGVAAQTEKPAGKRAAGERERWLWSERSRSAAREGDRWSKTRRGTRTEERTKER